VKDKSLRISATEFKARCLSVFKKLEKRQYTRVVVTRRGKPVAELTPPQTSPPSLWGALRGSVTIAPGVDLTAPTVEDRLDAGHGILHR
jgi:antitoxin (DNA-binding transcriptional repressor) of toxin-antitoxin stability system